MLPVSPFQFKQPMKLMHLFLQLDAFNRNSLIFRMCANTCLIGLCGSDCSPLTLSIKQIKLPFHSVALLITYHLSDANNCAKCRLWICTHVLHDLTFLDRNSYSSPNCLINNKACLRTPASTLKANHQTAMNIGGIDR